MTLTSVALSGIQRAMPLLLLGALLAFGVVFGVAMGEGSQGPARLQLMAVIVLAGAVYLPGQLPLGRAAWLVLLTLGAVAMYGAAQAIPLAIAPRFETPGHAVAAEALHLLSAGASPRPVSLSPMLTVDAVFALVPIAATLLIVAKARWSRLVEPLAWMIVALAATSAVLGALQAYGGIGTALYRDASIPPGHAVGIFLTPTDQAVFTLMALPFCLALTMQHRRQFQAGDGELGPLLGCVGLLGVLMGSLALNAGEIGLVLAGAGLSLTALVWWVRRRSAVSDYLVWAVVAALPVFAIGVLASVHLGPLGPAAGMDGVDRPELWTSTLTMAEDHMPFGIGFGAYGSVHPLYNGLEGVDLMPAPSPLDPHNGPLHLLVTGGIFGGGVLLAMAIGLVACVLSAWREEADDEGRLRRAASLALVIAALASLVSEPLLVPLLAIVAASCAGLLLIPSRRTRAALLKPEHAGDKRLAL